MSETQKKQLRRWEPILKAAAKRGDLEEARRAAGRIQEILRPTGHETRLMQDKVWLFEAALEGGEVLYATTGFVGIRQKVAKRTLTYRKATALLAVCHIRQRRMDKAKPLIKEALNDPSYAGKPQRRREVRGALIGLFQEESLLSEMRGSYREALDVDDIYDRAGNLVQTRSEEEILEYLGQAVPPRARARLEEVTEYARHELPAVDRRLLADPQSARSTVSVGRTALHAAKRVIWRSLCDESSSVWQVWNTGGVTLLAKIKMTAGAVAACLQRYDFAIAAVAVAAVALIVKMGIQWFCEVLPTDWVVDV